MAVAVTAGSFGSVKAIENCTTKKQTWSKSGWSKGGGNTETVNRTRLLHLATLPVEGYPIGKVV